MLCKMLLSASVCIAVKKKKDLSRYIAQAFFEKRTRIARVVTDINEAMSMNIGNKNMYCVQKILDCSTSPFLNVQPQIGM